MKKITLPEYIMTINQSVLSPLFDNNNDSYLFLCDIKKYGFMAIEKLPVDTQYKLMAMYISVYK